MKAELHTRRDGYRMYTVTDGKGGAWQVTHHVVRRWWAVQNRRGTSIDPYGALGNKIIDACEATFSEIDA